MSFDHLMSAPVPAGAPRAEREWSPMQQAIFAACRANSRNLLIEAVAGSGKTTTLIEAMDYCAVPSIFLAFNREIAQNIQSRIGKDKAKTLNGLGHQMWMRSAFGSNLDRDKLENILEHFIDSEIRKKYGYVIKRLVGTAKIAGLGLSDSEPADRGVFSQMIAGNLDFDVEDNDLASVAHACEKVFDISVNDRSTFDFDDQIYGPLYHNFPFPRFATVFVDEAQDLNQVQHMFLERLAARGARIIAVGDRHQSIYAFRGALHDSLDRLRDKFQMTELPLSVSYRCPELVIKEAQTLAPHIQARPDAPQGSVRSRAMDFLCEQRELCKNDPNIYSDTVTDQEIMAEAQDPEIFEEGWMVVCRNNAPLFSCVMNHVRARRPCQVRSNILEGLAAFVKRLAGRGSASASLSHLLDRLEAWSEKERLQAEAKGMPWKIQAIEDKVETLRSLCEGAKDVNDILFLIAGLSEGRRGPIFSTIHKAKGLEAEHIYILRPDLLPAPWVRDPAEIRQEMNLRYVAITRAKQTLTWGVSEGRRK